MRNGARKRAKYLLMAAGMAGVISGVAWAQPAYPNKPIRLIIPFPPAGGTDTVARLVGAKVTESWGQQVFVDNRPGGNTIIGTDALAKAAPDGYTIMLTSNIHVISPNLLPKLPYDSVKDFAPIATVSSLELVLTVHPSLPVKNLQEFIALAKARPGQLNYASSGSGGPTHLAGESFKLMAGVQMQHIPYKGAGPALNDLIGGQVQLYFTVPVNVVGFIKGGRLRGIAVTGEARLPALPQVPTFTEAGLAGFDFRTWYGILAPAGTPKAIVDKLSAEISRIVVTPEILEKLASQGMSPFISTPDQFAALIKADLAKFAIIVKAANIKADD